MALVLSVALKITFLIERVSLLDRALIHAEKRALVQAFERWETVSQFQFKDITALPPNDMDDEQFKVVLKADKGKTVTKILTVQAVNKKVCLVP